MECVITFHITVTNNRKLLTIYVGFAGPFVSWTLFAHALALPRLEMPWSLYQGRLMKLTTVS
jgi:hypothetical protein